MKVEELKLGGLDSAGAQVETIFARRAPHYAVYRTRERLLIHFADSSDAEQRAALATLGPLRGEINGLVDGWRSSPRDRVRAKALRYERRVADALVTALENDVEGARQLLLSARSDIYDERVSWARFQYLLVASAAAAVVMVLIFLVTSDWYQASIYDFPAASEPLFLAAAAGTLGAFFSIATGIRNRTVLPDLRVGDNSADAVLRIVVGLIASTVLIAVLQSGLVASPSFGGRSVDPDAPAPAAYSWALVTVIAFIAGFLERLVPDLLADSAILPLKPAKAGGATDAAAGVAATQATARQTAATPAANPSAAALPDEESDDCLDRRESEELITPDEDLPPARGGVATV